LGGLAGGTADAESEVASGASPSDGQSFLNRLKQECMASGNCLEDYPADGETVAGFADILIKLGFSVDEVEEMVSNLNSRASGNDVTFADLFKAASQLSEPEDAGGVTAMLDVAALPDLERMLSQLGLDLKTSQSILSDALVEGQGIDLRLLAGGIRRAVGAGSGIATGNPAEVLEAMRRIGLSPDEEISPKAGPDEPMSGEDGGADGLSGSLLLTCLQQLVARPGDKSDLRRLIASAGEENGGDARKALLSELARMQQGAASAVSAAGTAGKADGPADGGTMSLERFAAVLESRVAEAEGLSASGKASAARSLAETVSGFMEKVSSAAGNKRYSKPGSRLNAVTSASDTAGRQTAGRNTAQASGQTVSSGEAQRQSGAQASGTDSDGKLSDALGAAHRDKTGSLAEDARFGTEGFVREMRGGDAAASFGKAAAGRNLPGYLLNQVSRQIIRLRNAGGNEMTLHLKPAHLGRMKLNIEHASGGIRVGIVVESAAARDMLLANSHDLKTALSDQGLRLDRIDVETQTDFGQSMAQAGRGFGQSGGRKGRWAGQHRADAEGVSAPPVRSAAGAGSVESGRLDLVA